MEMNIVNTQKNSENKVEKIEHYLLIALILTATFTIVEFIGGFVFQSLALLSDAAHMFTDAASLIIAFVAIQIGKRRADIKRTFGYYRFEILAAVLNAIILFFVAIYIFYEAYHRLTHPSNIDPTGMMIVALFGLVINFISLRLLHKGSAENLCVRGAYLEAWADLWGSLGVLIAGTVIYFTHWQGVDSIIAIIIGLWIMPRTWILLKESINILLEGVPKGIEITKIQSALSSIPNVINVHDLHIWAVTSGKISLTVHLVIDSAKEDINSQTILGQANLILENEFKITHTTIQIETEHCGHDDLSPQL